jgi:hypothetical protein
MSSDGIHWHRGEGAVTGDRSATDVGFCLDSNEGNWWTLDTAAVAVSDVQLFSTDGPAGVYWMFYTGADYQPLQVPDGMPGMTPGAEVEGLCTRPGLAMSQVRRLRSHHHCCCCYLRAHS